MTKPCGRGFGNYEKGERILRIGDVRPGALLLMHSSEFNADNVIFVTHEFEERVWAHFVNPEDWTDRDGANFAIWDFELRPGGYQVQLWRAEVRK